MSAKLFRIILQVGDLAHARQFYEHLFGSDGREVGGGRVYFDTGAVILALLQPDGAPRPLAEYVYFGVDDLESFHARATEAKALASERIHGAEAGAIVRRPWGERSFYATDPWGNGLCFVDETTRFTGKDAR